MPSDKSKEIQIFRAKWLQPIITGDWCQITLGLSDSEVELIRKLRKKYNEFRYTLTIEYFKPEPDWKPHGDDDGNL